MNKLTVAETYPEPPQESKRENVTTMFNGFEPLTIVAKLSFLDVCLGPS